MLTKEDLLNKLTVKQLKQLAKENKVDLVSEGFLWDSAASTKEEIIEVLTNSNKITKEKILSLSQATEKNLTNPNENQQTTKEPTTENIATGYYCTICKETISNNVYNFSKNRYGKPLCMTHQKTIAIPPPPPKTYPQKNYFCHVCNETISEPVYDYSRNHFGAALCMRHQKTVTPQAIKLSNALKNLDVKHKLEYSDGYKHIDIAIESAKLYLELDGTQHGFSPKQMCADDERDKYSLRDGFVTKRIPNVWVDQNVDRLAASIAVLANKRQFEIRESEKKISLSGIVKTVLTKLSETLENYE